MELFMDKIESPLGEMLLVTDDQGTDQSVSIGFKLTLANRLQNDLKRTSVNCGGFSHSTMMGRPITSPSSPPTAASRSRKSSDPISRRSFPCARPAG